jgi:hypothetical protein
MVAEKKGYIISMYGWPSAPTIPHLCIQIMQVRKTQKKRFVLNMYRFFSCSCSLNNIEATYIAFTMC